MTAMWTHAMHRARLTLMLAVVAGLSLWTGSGAAQPAGQAEANKAVVRQLYAAINAHDLNDFAALLAPTFVDHNAPPGLPAGPEGGRLEILAFVTAFPDLRVALDDILAEGDRVFVRDRGIGTHLGDFNGIPPTGRPVTIEGFNIYRVVGGRIGEFWHVDDIFGLLVQLGVVPAPGGGAAPAAAVPPAASSQTAATAQQLEANKALVRRIYEIFNSHNLDALDDLLALDFVDHNPVPGQPPGAAGAKVALQAFIDACPDIRVSLEDLVAEGDKVVDRGRAPGTHTGDFLGIPATGRGMVLEFMDEWPIQDGKVVEIWHMEDVFGLLVQLGVIPAPGQAPAPVTPRALPSTGDGSCADEGDCE